MGREDMQSQKHRPRPQIGAEFKLHPVQRQRTVTPHPTWLPKSPSYGSSSPYQASGVSQYTRKDPACGMAGEGEVCALPRQAEPL